MVYTADRRLPLTAYSSKTSWVVELSSSSNDDYVVGGQGVKRSRYHFQISRCIYQTISFDFEPETRRDQDPEWRERDVFQELQAVDRNAEFHASLYVTRAAYNWKLAMASPYSIHVQSFECSDGVGRPKRGGRAPKSASESNILGVTISDKLSVSDRPHQLVCAVCSIHAIRTLRTHVSHMACARRRVFRSVVAKLAYTHAVNACGALLRQLIGSEWRQSSAGEFTLDCAVRIS